MKKFEIQLRTKIWKWTVIQVEAEDETLAIQNFEDGVYDEMDGEYIEEEEVDREISTIQEIVEKSKKPSRSKK